MEDSTESILQSITPLSYDTLNHTFIHMVVNISDLPDLNKKTFALEIERRWGKDIIEEVTRKTAYMRGGTRMEQG